MDLTSVGFFDLAERRMSYLDRRSAVQADNIANADTPGWRTRDLKPFNAALAQAGVAPVLTNPLHLPGTSVHDPALQLLAGERSPDGNAVRLDVELEKVADTDSAHMLVSDLWKKYLGMFSLALGR
jgi:flagellar basal-body rod protein FlgB